MSRYADVVLTQARKWLGKKEKDGSHREIIDVYNSQKVLPRNYRVQYNDEWCATFVSAVSIKVGYTDIIPPECGCERMIELFRKLGCFIENDKHVPEPGTILFYDWHDSGKGDCKGWSDHVGIVEKVNGNVITIIEGNRDNSVKRVRKNVNSRYIRGYAVPKYDDRNTEIAKEVILGLWGNGADRKRRLTEAGYNYKEIQSIVNAMLRK